MKWTDELRIETPEQIDVDLELAGLGSRFVAQAFDWLLKGLVSLLLLVLAGIVAGVLGTFTSIEAVPKMVIALVVAVLYFLWLTYDIVCEVTRNGQTLGKQRAGIRVLREGGAAIDFRTSCVRNLLAIADFMPFFFLVGSLLILLTARRQRLGDLAAGTIVVRERTLAAPAETAALVTELARPDIAFAAGQLCACAPADRQVLRSFLQRADSMAPPEWERLANRLAGQFAKKVGGTAPPPEDAAAYLASLYRDLEAHARSAL